MDGRKLDFQNRLVLINHVCFTVTFGFKRYTGVELTGGCAIVFLH